jgi:hypothetical protein
VLAQAHKAQRLRWPHLQAAKKSVTQQVGPYWAAGWLCEAAWQFAFVKNTPTTLIISSIILFLALIAFQIALSRVHTAVPQPALPKWTKMLFVFATSLNAAWLSVAASAGLLIAVGAITKTSLTSLAVVLAVIVVLGGTAVTYFLKDPFYGLTLCWAFAGVYAEQSPSDKNPVIGTVACVAIAASAAAAGVAILLRNPRRCTTQANRPLVAEPLAETPHAVQ